MVQGSDKNTNVLFIGLGGQGIILASDMLADAALAAGYDVKKSELHGMSQRGGSVSSEVRFGAKVFSPMIPEHTADYILALNADELSAYENMKHEHTVVITPDDIDEEYRNSRMLNIAMLGKLNKFILFPGEIWEHLIHSVFKDELIQQNTDAFNKGFNTK